MNEATEAGVASLTLSCTQHLPRPEPEEQGLSEILASQVRVVALGTWKLQVRMR